MAGNIPLYKTASTPGGNGNSGLRFNKFCNTWGANWSLKSEGKSNPKMDWVKKFSNLNHVGDEKELLEFITRRELMSESNKGLISYFKTTSPFIAGMGNTHPIENGFTWHHSLGVPYIPGSSIKGLVREWAENWLSDTEENCWDNEEEKKDIIVRIFCSDRKEKPTKKCTGSISFLDAIPTKPIKLKAEIMTPHYGEYYQDATGETAPGDWLSPVPIPFLAVDVGQVFQFSMLERDVRGSENDLFLVSTWLNDALANLGGGAKSAVGYGVFELSTLERMARNTVNEVLISEAAVREQKKKNNNKTLIKNTLSNNMLIAYEIIVQLEAFKNDSSINRQVPKDRVATAINNLFKQDFSQWNEDERREAVKICKQAYDTPGIGWYRDRKKKDKQEKKKRDQLDLIWKED